MNYLRQRLSGKLYRGVLACGRPALFVGMLAVAIFIFLRVHGIPEPMLQEMVRRANVAGMPVAINELKLTLRGWRATDVRYYSQHPDDLDPILTAERIYFVRHHRLPGIGSKGWYLKVTAEDVVVHPSVGWGLDVPQDSPMRKVKRLDASLGFLSDRINISRGKVNWMGLRLHVNGSVLKAATSTPDGPLPVPRETRPVFVGREDIQKLERLLQMLDPKLGTRAEISFSIDAGDLASSRFDFRVETDEFDFNGTPISHLEVAGAYAYPHVELRQALLRMGTESARVTGEYNLKNKQVEGSLSNGIQTEKALGLVPDPALRMMSKFGFKFDTLPLADLQFGPAVPTNLYYTISGPFSVGSMAYDGLEIRSLQGRVEGDLEARQLAVKEISGSVLDQPDLADAVGSSMKGGMLDKGEVLWDANTMEFGVTAAGSFDPNLLLRPLDFVPVATNIIHLFLFEDRPPTIQLSLGACVKNWSTFYINVQGSGEDLALRNVPLSSLTATAEYKNGCLRLDPVAGFQGARATKGSTLIDFRNKIVSFDVISAMPPADWEDIVYADLGVFGSYIKTSDNVQINARGIFDWGSMESTRFTAEVESDALAVSKLASTDSFTARVEGRGSSIVVSDAVFGIYNGKGSGRFSMDWSPARNAIPYTLDAELSGADFQRFVSFCSEKPAKVTGSMKGNIHVAADLSTNFFATAKGEGFVKVSEGQLHDLPLFKEFSNLIRKIIPGFSVFSISKLRSDFTIADGAVASKEVYFEGDILSAKGKGKYVGDEGFDATLEVQVFKDSRLTKVVQVITSPLMKLLKIRLEGPLDDPSWKLDNF